MVLDKKLKILIGLALILVVMLTYRMANPFRQQTVSKLTYGRTNKIVSSPAKDDQGKNQNQPTLIRADLMAPPPRLDSKVHRDPFRRPVPKTPARAPKPAEKRPQPLTTPDEGAREKLQRFKVFGTFHQGDRVSLFLQRGKQVLVVNTGDRIDGKYKIEAIEGRRVVVSTPDLPSSFQFEFEELDPAGPLDYGPASAPTARDFPSRRPTGGTTSNRATQTPPPDLTDSMTTEGEEDLSPPDLPKPPPVEKPAPPFRSNESPSRNYLPGTRPAD